MVSFPQNSSKLVFPSSMVIFMRVWHHNSWFQHTNINSPPKEHDETWKYSLFVEQSTQDWVGPYGKYGVSNTNHSKRWTSQAISKHLVAFVVLSPWLLSTRPWFKCTLSFGVDCIYHSSKNKYHHYTIIHIYSFYTHKDQNKKKIFWKLKFIDHVPLFSKIFQHQWNSLGGHISWSLQNVQSLR